MSTKITFEINGWSYSITADDNFATYLQLKIDKDFKLITNDSRKLLVQAYVNAQYELFSQEQKIEHIANTLNDLS